MMMKRTIKLKKTELKTESKKPLTLSRRLIWQLFIVMESITNIGKLAKGQETTQSEQIVRKT